MRWKCRLIVTSLTELSMWRNTDFDKKQQNPLSNSVSTKTLLDSGLHFVVGVFVSVDDVQGIGGSSVEVGEY